LKSDYVVVLVDVNEDHNSEVDKKYGNPMRFGLPAIETWMVKRVKWGEPSKAGCKTTRQLHPGPCHIPRGQEK